MINLENQTLESVFSGFDSKHRNMVRRGERSEIEVKFGGLELIEDYMQLDRETWERSNKAGNGSDFYKKYIHYLGDKVLVGIAYKDALPQCGLIGFYNEAMFYYMFGASANRPEPGSTHYLQYRTIELMLEKSVKAYNFVGCRINVDKDSKYARIQHFKKGFGGELVECYLFRSVLNKPKKMMFDTLSFIKNGKSQPTVIDDEIGKWKDINK